jgi:hypothetical protein
MEIYFWSIVVLLAYNVIKSSPVDTVVDESGEDVTSHWFAGFNTLTWIVVVNGGRWCNVHFCFSLVLLLR